VSGPTLARVARSELIKLLSLRSTVVSYLGIGLTMAAVVGVYMTLPEGGGESARNASFTGLVLLELMVGAVGVLAGAGEYAAGTMRSTLVAVPRRGLVLAAKLLVHGGSVLALLASATAITALMVTLLAPGKVGSLGDPEILRALSGTGLGLAGACAIGVAAGIITRSIAAAIGIVFVLVFLPVVVVFAPTETAFLPGRTIQALVLADRAGEAGLLAPGAAVASLTAWVAAAIAAAAACLRGRDA
jgi:ABC-2 type transport system permease protein